MMVPMRPTVTVDPDVEVRVRRLSPHGAAPARP